MRLVDELFAMYRDRLTGDEEDLEMISFAVLEHSNRAELLNIVKDMNDYELQYFIRLYLMETLKGKFAQLDDNDYYSDKTSKHLH